MKTDKEIEEKIEEAIVFLIKNKEMVTHAKVEKIVGKDKRTKELIKSKIR